MTPEEEAQVEAEIAQAKKETEGVIGKIQSDIKWMNEEQEKWSGQAEKARKKRKHDNLLLYTLFAMHFSSNIFLSETNINFLREVNRLAIESVRNSISLSKVIERIPDMEKKKEELDQIIQTEVQSLKAIAKKLQDAQAARKEGQPSQPPLGGPYA
ncbi:MAG: hypothetical protein LYZ69_03500 [Nitrososphaerales archaeon]|nr:hypothetical protein [Nitrososphaerales archaeon]